MRRPSFSALATVLCAAANVPAVSANGTRAFAGDASNVASKGRLDCHRSFPAFFWAGSKAGEQRQTGYQHAATESSEVAAMVLDAATDAKDVEVVVVVLSQGDSFSTSGVSDANAVAKAGGDSDASLHAQSATATFPYTYPAASTLRVAMPLLAEEMGARVQEVSLAEVVPAVVESGVLSDGKLDLVFAVVPETASVKETDAAVRSVTSSLESASKGRFLLLWTGDFHEAGCGRRALAAEAAVHRRLQTETTSRTIKMTPDILSGLLTIFLFLFILVAGLGCMGDIECPRSFALVKPASGREY